MTLNPIIPPADLHTPEELLDNAETLFAYNNPKMMRAAVLEAITALESYVQIVVFSSLKEKLDITLVKWLEEKTKMDFDSRLSVLAPVAIGQPIDKQSALWVEYKKAKEIRNKVTHSGRKVSPVDARFVIDTVYKWLACLSTVELELALIGLKKYIEENSIKINSEREAVSLIGNYLGKTGVTVSARELEISAGIRVDLVLKFGSFTTLVETKYVSAKANAQERIFGALQQIKKYLAITGITQGAVIIFNQGESSYVDKSVVRYPFSLGGGKESIVYAVVIKV